MSVLTSTTPARLARRGIGQLRLLLRNPEAFARNLRQLTNPDGFRRDLLDLVEIEPLDITVNPAAPATLNVVLPAIEPQKLTGGPNTVLNIGAHIAASGIPVRFISSAPLAADAQWFPKHLAALSAIPPEAISPHLVSGHTAPVTVGPDDLFMASFWTTAHQVAPLQQRLNRKRFLYVIQDFEPGFYKWSSNHARALQTYDFPFLGVINGAMLADYLFQQGIGQFADAAFLSRCQVFEPALDRRMFHPPTARDPSRPRRLLVYARPTNERNLLGLAITALKLAIERKTFEGAWDFLAIGGRGSIPAFPLAGGHILRPAPWRDYSGYAQLLRESDILLSPMLSPHPSYPPLEMAACGGVAVTNVFATKTAARLAAMSDLILAVEPSVEGFAEGLARAVRMSAERPETRAAASVAGMPPTWRESLAGVVRMVRHEFAATPAGSF